MTIIPPAIGRDEATEAPMASFSNAIESADHVVYMPTRPGSPPPVESAGRRARPIAEPRARIAAPADQSPVRDLLGCEVSAQTNLVIDSAHDLADWIARMSKQLPYLGDRSQQDLLRREIVEASERLCNLVGLAYARVEQLGGSPSQRESLAGLRTAVVRSSGLLVVRGARRLTRDAEALRDGRRERPFGINVTLVRRLNNLIALVATAGGFDAIGEAAHHAIDDAMGAVRGCLALEGGWAHLADYDGRAAEALTLPVVPPRRCAMPGVASQHDVLAIAASRSAERAIPA
ncbi:MAG: hypothetical protein HQL40_12130 [Alphaproteobacteria bacterium]|nr:hypothetical protein [Alphaproteobacteria bacterium]